MHKIDSVDTNKSRTDVGINKFGIAANITAMLALFFTGIYVGWSLLELIDHLSHNVIRIFTTSAYLVFFLNLGSILLCILSLYFCKKQTEVNYNLTIKYIEYLIWFVLIPNLLHFIWGFFNSWYYLT